MNTRKQRTYQRSQQSHRFPGNTAVAKTVGNFQISFSRISGIIKDLGEIFDLAAHSFSFAGAHRPAHRQKLFADEFLTVQLISESRRRDITVRVNKRTEKTLARLKHNTVANHLRPHLRPIKNPCYTAAQNIKPAGRADCSQKKEKCNQKFILRACRLFLSVFQTRCCGGV